MYPWDSSPSLPTQTNRTTTCLPLPVGGGGWETGGTWCAGMEWSARLPSPCHHHPHATTSFPFIHVWCAGTQAGATTCRLHTLLYLCETGQTGGRLRLLAFLGWAWASGKEPNLRLSPFPTTLRAFASPCPSLLTPLCNSLCLLGQEDENPTPGKPAQPTSFIRYACCLSSPVYCLA